VNDKPGVQPTGRRHYRFAGREGPAMRTDLPAGLQNLFPSRAMNGAINPSAA
jgi:hypothetical protein